VKKGFILYPRPGKHDITTSMCGLWKGITGTYLDACFVLGKRSRQDHGSGVASFRNLTLDHELFMGA
jgi:hypothetical protein